MTEKELIEKHLGINTPQWIVDKLKWLLYDYEKSLTLPRVIGSGFKGDMLKAFLAGRQLEKENKITNYDEKGKEIEHGGFNGWFHYNYR